MAHQRLISKCLKLVFCGLSNKDLRLIVLVQYIKSSVLDALTNSFKTNIPPVLNDIISVSEYRPGMLELLPSVLCLDLYLLKSILHLTVVG